MRAFSIGKTKSVDGAYSNGLSSFLPSFTFTAECIKLESLLLGEDGMDVIWVTH